MEYLSEPKSGVLKRKGPFWDLEKKSGIASRFKLGLQVAVILSVAESI
jgi:hypothetical protein